MGLIRKVEKRGPLNPPVKVGCAFCWEWIPQPTVQNGASGDSFRGGQCECGAYFVIDDTGKSGGQTLLELRALACNGDLEAALAMQEGVDCEVRDKPLVDASVTRSTAGRGGSYMKPKVWFLRLRGLAVT